MLTAPTRILVLLPGRDEKREQSCDASRRGETLDCLRARQTTSLFQQHARGRTLLSIKRHRPQKTDLMKSRTSFPRMAKHYTDPLPEVKVISRSFAQKVTARSSGHAPPTRERRRRRRSPPEVMPRIVQIHALTRCEVDLPGDSPNPVEPGPPPRPIMVPPPLPVHLVR